MKIQSIKSDYGTLGERQSHKRQPSFKRVLEEHLSWGANYISNTGKTNFKFFSFPDAKAVFVEVADKAAVGFKNIRNRFIEVVGLASGTGLAFNRAITVDDNSKAYKMEHLGDGVYIANNIEAKPDDKYRFVIVDGAKNVNIVKDPYSKKQDNIHGWSSIYNPNNYEWKNTDWLDGKDSRRIIRKPEEALRGLEKLRIEEINIPTLTKEGTFISAKKEIDNIAKRGIANTIEIMPVENTYSKQWGYDGVDKFAVNKKLGTPEELKELIDYAHGKGLNVIMDMVPNHIGPDGDYLMQTGPYEKGPGEFGGEFNYEEHNNRYVRDWMVNAVLWWVNEFKVDGIRLDMTKKTNSDYLLKQIVDEVNEHNKNVFLIAEDGRNNKLSVTRYDNNKKTHEERINETDMFVDLITRNIKSTPQDIGFDSEWDFPFMHALKDAITNNNQASIGLINDTIRDSQYRVKYIMSHDEIGNLDGTRLIPKILAQYLDFFNNIDGENSTIKGQKAAHLAQALIRTAVVKENATENDLKNIQEKFGMKHIYNKETLINAMKAAVAKSKLAYGTVMTVPGPKMIFQGEDNFDLSYFKFFRNFSPEFYQYPPNQGLKEMLDKEKGYDTSVGAALQVSVLGQTEDGEIYKKIKNYMTNYNRDIVKLLETYPALERGKIVSTYNDYDNLVHIHCLEDGNDKFVVIKNFADRFHDGTYSTYGFPNDGTYIEILNSNSKKYGGSGTTNQGREIKADDQRLNLSANTIAIFKRI